MVVQYIRPGRVRGARGIKGVMGRCDTATDPSAGTGGRRPRTLEFFTAQIRNPHTRAAYAAAVTRFFTWCDARGRARTQMSPIAVATYLDDIHGRYRAPSTKQHLAALRRLVE